MEKKKDIEKMDTFLYMDSLMSADGSSDTEVKARLTKARHAFTTLRNFGEMEILLSRGSFKEWMWMTSGCFSAEMFEINLKDYFTQCYQQ